MLLKWTTTQLAAINSRNKNLLVAAAAGSGKTAVLVERIIQLIIDGGLDVDRMLIVTFTNAAAQEMRSRIHRALLKKLSEIDDSEIIARLERQSILLSNASISTFHSFCLSVLKRHFSKIDFDPKFREATEHELKILQQEVIEELFENKYADDEDFAKFTDDFGGNVQGDSDLYDLIIDLNDFSKSRPYPEEWLNSLKVSDDTRLCILIDFVMATARKYIEDCRAECNELIKLAANFNLYVSCLYSDSELFENLIIATKNFNDLYNGLQNLKFARLSLPRNLPPEVEIVKEEIKKRREDYKDKLKKLHKRFFTQPLEDIITETKEIAPSIDMLVKTVSDFDVAFTKAKRERGIIDFSDMEHLALKILNTDKYTAAVYREKFKIIMVDEYQDTNGVQEEIISKIVGRNNFFAVGDVKQSIYRFRNADPEIFMQKYDDYPKDTDLNERIDLSKNFRSRQQVVDAVNIVFKSLMTKEAMEIEYDENAQLNFGANYPNGENTFDERAELHIIDADPRNFDDSEDDDTETSDELDEVEREIQFIANEINSMMSADNHKQVWDGDHYRPLEFRDIVILVRSIDKIGTKIVEFLKDNGINAYAADKDGYFQAVEIQTVMSLLNLLDNMRQDIPLATVMLSPIGGFCAEDLAKLRIGNRDADLYTLVSESDDIKCIEFLSKINLWREIARQVSVPELLSMIYRETGCYDYFGKNLDGKIAQANLRMLIDRAADYEKTAFRGLSRFIQYIKKLRNMGNDLSAARTLGESENVVRIMTIHKSKGLEFPVVFVARLGKKFNMQDLAATIIPHRDLGVGIYKVSENGVGKLDTFIRKAVAYKVRLETLAEELRILYVAFTRAREKLIMVGTSKNKKEFQEIVNISNYKIQSAERPLDWLLMIRDVIQNTIDISIHSVDDIKKDMLETPIEEVAEEKVLVKIDKVPSSPLDNIPAKLSVTEIKRRINEATEDVERIFDKQQYRREIYRRPSFMLNTKVTAAELGTIVHSVMQHLDIGRELDGEGISMQIDEMVTNKILTPEQRDAVKFKIPNIKKFFESRFGRSMIEAQEIYRELPFNMYIDAGEVFENAKGEKIFVQGIVDVLFMNAETKKWILLDYKTDRDKPDDFFKKEYREQIRLYVAAIETLTKIRISEKYLYLLSANRLVDMRD